MYLCIIFCSFGLLFGGWGSGCLAWGFLGFGFGLGTSFGKNSHGILFHPTECGVFRKKKYFSDLISHVVFSQTKHCFNALPQENPHCSVFSSDQYSEMIMECHI